MGDIFDFTGQAPFTIEAWVRPQADDLDGVVVAKSDYTEEDGYMGWLLVIHVSGGIFTLYRGRRDGRSAAVTYFEQSLGVGDGSPRALDAASPAKHADRVQAAVLLIHGRDDSVVLSGQSRNMERALRDAGKTVQYVQLDGEDHWLSQAKTRLETLEAVDQFLALELGSR